VAACRVFVCELCGVQLRLRVLDCNFSKEQSMLPEDDRMIETFRSALSVILQTSDY